LMSHLVTLTLSRGLKLHKSLGPCLGPTGNMCSLCHDSFDLNEMFVHDCPLFSVSAMLSLSNMT
jgi:hypothetical protein